MRITVAGNNIRAEGSAIAVVRYQERAARRHSIDGRTHAAIL